MNPIDLAVIVAMQLGMLGYGLHALALNRPAFMVASVDRLELVRAGEINAEDLAAAPPQFRRLSWTGPIWVGARLPDDHEERNRLLLETFAGRDLQMLPRYYEPFDEVLPELLPKRRPLGELLPRLTTNERKRLLAGAETGELEHLHYLTINSSRGAALVLIDDQGRLGATIAVDPFDVRARGGATSKTNPSERWVTRPERGNPALNVRF